MIALPNHDCPLCGQPNQCAPARCATLEVDCWCRTASVSRESLALIPEAQRRLACLCQQCAKAPPSGTQRLPGSQPVQSAGAAT